MIFDERGNLIDKEKVQFSPYFSECEGYAEQYAEVYWDSFCAASKGLRARNEGLWQNIIGVAVTTMRDVGICLDENMQPLRPCIMWLDRREAKCKKMLPFKSRFLFSLSGMRETVEKNMRDCRLNWIQENEPEIWARTKKFVLYSAYINYLLTGELKDSVASTIGHIPLDYKKKKWMKRNHLQRACFGKLTDDMLYPIVEAGEILGHITRAAAESTGIPAGLPVIAAGSDKGCETIGTGTTALDVASLSFGTTSTLQLTTDHYVEPYPFLPAYPSVYPGRYNPEIIVYRGYWMVTWFINEFLKRDEQDSSTPEHDLDEAMSKIPPCCDGLYAEPFWSPTLKRPEAKGALIGFNETHTKIHIYRALLEGIDFALLDGLKGLEAKTGVKVKRLMVSGGGAQSDVVCQMTADLFGIPVVRCSTFETSGLGAAICAFVGLKCFAGYDEAIAAMVHHQQTFEPDPQRHEIYRHFYETVYAPSYRTIKPLFHRIEKFRRG